MVSYNRGCEKTRRPEEFRPRKELKPARTLVYEENEFDANLRTMKTEGEFTMFARTLRRAREEGEISNEDFDEYMFQAQKKLKKINVPSRSKEMKQKVESIESSEAKPSKNEEERITGYGSGNKNSDSMRVRGEKNLDEETIKAKLKSEEKLGTKIGKFKAFVEFMQTPIARVLFFIIVGVFLLIYLTKSNMGDLLGSPMIIVLVVVFMLLILGKGGKTRRHDYSDSQLGY